MSIIYGSPLFLSSSSQNADLPPLLDNFKASVPVEGIPVKNMPVGTKIKVPVNTDYQSFLGKNITWMVIDHAHTGYPQNYTTLRTEKIIACLSFDAGEPENTDSNRRSNGNNNYFVSNIDCWLNSDKPAGKWWSKSHTYDSAPTTENVSHNPYKDKSGFLAMLNSEFVNIILKTPIKYKQPDVDSVGLVTANRKVFLLSETELGGTSNGEGNKFSIYTDDESRKHYPTQEAYDNSAYKDSNFATNKPWYVWTRTQDSSNSSYVRRIFIQGNIDFNTAKAGIHGIVPVCNISSDTLLNAEPDSDGCYTLAELAPVTIAESDDCSITLSADKMEESRAEQLAGVVWVYGDHSPANVNDGTKIQLTREEIIRPDTDPYITLADIPVSDADTETIVNLKESDKKLHSYILLNGNYELSGGCLLLRKDIISMGKYRDDLNTSYTDSIVDIFCTTTFYNTLDERVQRALIDANIQIERNLSKISRKAFLLSTTEMQNGAAGSGTYIPYFSNDDRRIATLNQSPLEYFTRDYARKNSTIHTINESGKISTNSPNNSLGYRPAIVISPEFKLKIAPNEDGSYDMYDETPSVSTYASSEFTVEKQVSWEKTKDFYARQFTYNSKKQYQTMLEGAVAKLTLVGVPKPVTELAETHSVQSITLTWKNPTDDELYDHTVVVYKTDAYPASIDDGTVAYSGTDQTTTISDLQLGTTYYISVFTVSISGIYGTPQAISVEIPAGQLISSLPSNSKVKLGKFNGQDLKWLVCRDSADQSLRLILDGASVSFIGNKMFDNAEPSNSNSDRRQYGNNRYIWSNIHQWLNSNKVAGAWYSAQHSVDAPPGYTNVAGFLNGWTEKEIGVLENANWVVTRHSVDGGGTESFYSRIVLPSTTEMGLESGTGGSKLDIFNSDGDRVVSGVRYWCRTPYPSNSNSVRSVDADGTLDYYYAYNTGYGVRPLCKPLSNTLVSPETDGEGYFTIV